MFAGFVTIFTKNRAKTLVFIFRIFLPTFNPYGVTRVFMIRMFFFYLRLTPDGVTDLLVIHLFSSYLRLTPDGVIA